MNHTPATTEIAKYTCPMHPEVTDTKPGKCPKCGMVLKPVKNSSMEHATVSEATITASVTTKAPLQIGQKIEVILRLANKDGSPVLLSDLEEAHTKKLHLLIIDRSLTDYHHEHPQQRKHRGNIHSASPRKNPVLIVCGPTCCPPLLELRNTQ